MKFERFGHWMYFVSMQSDPQFSQELTVYDAACWESFGLLVEHEVNNLEVLQGEKTHMLRNTCIHASECEYMKDKLEIVVGVYSFLL